MSRRCDVMGVPYGAIPRDFWEWTPNSAVDVLWDAHPDPLQRRVAHRRELNQPDDKHCAHLCTRGWVLAHLRERPVLPPWIQVTFNGRKLGRIENADVFLDALLQMLRGAA